MKNPLHYQFSEYDCGPTSMQNAISFLFEREEIPPEVLRNIMLYCLDCYSSEGVPGKKWNVLRCHDVSVELAEQHGESWDSPCKKPLSVRKRSVSWK